MFGVRGRAGAFEGGAYSWGDRVWIAPERGLFFLGEVLEDGVVTQRSIDPGEWVETGRVRGGEVAE